MHSFLKLTTKEDEMNETVKTQLNHKTIRKFKDKKIEKEVIDILFDVAVRSASSNGMYSYSMIHVTGSAPSSAPHPASHAHWPVPVPTWPETRKARLSHPCRPSASAPGCRNTPCARARSAPTGCRNVPCCHRSAPETDDRDRKSVV